MQEMLKDPANSISSKYQNYLQMRIQEPLPMEIKHIDRILHDRKELLNPKKRAPNQRLWIKAEGKLPDDLAVHQCVAAYASDHYLASTASLKHGLIFKKKYL